MAVICRFCSTENPDSHLYCNGCGISFASDKPFENIGEVLPHKAPLQTLKPYLGYSDYRALKKAIRYALLSLFIILGAATSPYGHIYTTGIRLIPFFAVPLLYLLMYLVSYISPVLALRCSLAFCLADFIQKLVVDDVYYPGTRTAADWGLARIGYLFSYLSVFLAALLPGLFARVLMYQGFRYSAQLIRRWSTRILGTYLRWRRQHAHA